MSLYLDVYGTWLPIPVLMSLNTTWSSGFNTYLCIVSWLVLIAYSYVRSAVKVIIMVRTVLNLFLLYCYRAIAFTQNIKVPINYV